MSDYMSVDEYVEQRTAEVTLELDMLTDRGPDGPTEFRAQRDALDRYFADIEAYADGVALTGSAEDTLAEMRKWREGINARMARWGMS